MKKINFTVKEILLALLNKTKTQTIRPAWDIYAYKKNGIWKKRQPKFKVGDLAKIMWNQRSKSNKFCRNCGTGLGNSVIPEPFCPKCHKPTSDFFTKTIGVVKITEVFEIEMRKLKEDTFCFIRFPTHYIEKDNVVHALIQPPEKEEELAKRDGFKSVEDMFKLFDKIYDLSTPKPFFVYRWRWLK